MASLKANIAQERAVSTLYGPEIIVSCPGSGKTTTLVRRINRLVESGVEPGSILMVTINITSTTIPFSVMVIIL